MNETSRPRRSRRHLGWKASAAVALVLAALAVLLVGLLHLPPLQKVAAGAGIRAAGRALGASVEAGSIRWSFFPGTLEVRDLAIRGEGERAGTEISVGRLSAGFSVTALLQGRVVVERALVERPTVRLAVTPGGDLLLPFRLPPSKRDRDRERPAVEVRELRLTGGLFELADRGKAARRLDVAEVALEGSVRLRDLASTGTLTLGRIDLSGSGREPLRGSSLTAGWETRGESGSMKARLVATEAGLAAGLDAEVRELTGTPRYEAAITVSGALGPLAARLASDLGLEGKVEGRIEASGEGAHLASAKGTFKAEALTLLGRTFDRVEVSADLAGGLLRRATAEVAVGSGRLRMEASGTVHPALKDLRFSLRAERVDVARLLTLPSGGTKVAGTLDGTVQGTLSTPSLSGLSAAAELTVSGGRPDLRTVAPEVRARLRLAKGVVTVESADLAERSTTASVRGEYDHLRRAFEGSLDVESANIGPYLALFGLEGKGELSAHVRGGGPVTRPVLEGRLRARALAVGGVRADCLELDARAEGERFSLSNGAFSAYGLSGGADAGGSLPLPGVKAPTLDLRLVGVKFRGRSLSDVTAHATLGTPSGAPVDVRAESSDGGFSAHATLPPGGGFRAEAVFDRFDLTALGAFLPERLADFRGEVTGRLDASRSGSGPLEASVRVGDLAVAAAGLRFRAAGAEAQVRGETFDLRGIELKGDDGSFLKVSGHASLDGSAISALVRVELPDLSIFAPLLRDAPETGPPPLVGGSVSADLRIGGSRGRPEAAGSVRARNVSAFGATLASLDATLKPAGEGRLAGSVALAGLGYGDHRLEEAHLDVNLEGDELSAEGEALGGRLRVKGTGSLAGARPFDATAALAALDVAPFLRVRDAAKVRDLALRVTGRVRARGALADLRGVSVDADLDAVEATHPKWNVHAAEPVKVAIGRGMLEVRSLRLSGTGLSLEASGRLPFEDGGNDRISVASSLDLALLLPFVDALDRASGRVEARLEVGGSLSRPVPAGSLRVEGALLDGPSFPAPIEKLTGTVALKPGEIRTESLSAQIGGGSVALTGALALAHGRPAHLDASLRVRDLEIEPMKDVEVRAGADLTAKGDWRSLGVAGEVRLEDVVYVPVFDTAGFLKEFGARLRRTAPSRKGETASRPGPSPFVPGVSFDVAVLARDAIHLEGGMGDAELGGSLRLKGTLQEPVLLGSISSTRGTLNLFGSIFDLSRCQVDFSDPLAIDPDLDVVATTTKNDEEITLRIRGKASKAQLLLSSSKGKSQAEIVQTLFGGPGGSGSALTAAATKMALRGAATPFLGALGAQADVHIVPLPTTPEGESFLFSIGKELGGGLSATYFKGASGETTDAFELKWKISPLVGGRLRQNQDGSLSGGFRIKRELD